jgi:hypothetical protein
MSTTRWIPLLLVAVLPLAACERDEADERFETGEAIEGLERAPGALPPVEVQPPDAAEQPDAPGVAARRIEVTNPMPHPMIVTATIDGRSVELGTVGADGTAEFTVRTTAGATVQLEARDEPDTHRVRGTVTVGETRVRWRIQQ